MKTNKENINKKKNKWIILPIIIYSILLIGIIIIIIYAYTEQYNLKGISNTLSVYIDEDRDKEYIGNLNDYKIYVENLRTEELHYLTFNDKRIPLKEAIDKKQISINDWKRGAWYIFKYNDTELLRYESYEIAITQDECIIRPISKYKSVDIKCHNDNTYRITLKKGNSFGCVLLNKEYDFKIKSINKNNIIIKASDYGLTKIKDKEINLNSKEKKFIIEKNKKEEISTQSIDYNEKMIIEWY